MFWMKNKENSFPICTLIWRTAHCLWGFYVWSLFGYAVLSVLSSFCNHLDGEERAGCLKGKVRKLRTPGKFEHTFANSGNPDETAPYEPSHQDFHCLLSLFIFLF